MYQVELFHDGEKQLSNQKLNISTGFVYISVKMTSMFTHYKAH